MTDEEIRRDQKAIRFGMEAARDVDRLLDLYHFAAIALVRWPKTLAELVRYRTLARRYRKQLLELQGRKV